MDFCFWWFSYEKLLPSALWATNQAEAHVEHPPPPPHLPCWCPAGDQSGQWTSLPTTPCTRSRSAGASTAWTTSSSPPPASSSTTSGTSPQDPRAHANWIHPVWFPLFFCLSLSLSLSQRLNCTIMMWMGVLWESECVNGGCGRKSPVVILCCRWVSWPLTWNSCNLSCSLLIESTKASEQPTDHFWISRGSVF